MIYLDNAATTKVSLEVFSEMLPYFSEDYGNASSVYQFGVKPRNAISLARESCAKLIGAAEQEIYFTSGGSESDNWVLSCVPKLLMDKGKHIITTQIEHHAVLNAAKQLEREGFEVTYLPVDKYGLVSLESLEAAVRPDTVLISVMFANNEVGTIQPVAQIGEFAHSRGILFHTDAVQAFGHIPIDVKAMNIDYLSASAHKINGPKGVGLLYASKDAPLDSFIRGGMQERGFRAGTLNTPGIVGMGAATKIAASNIEAGIEKNMLLRERMIERVLKEIPESTLNGHRSQRLPNNASFCFEGVEGESLLIMLDMKGICVSSGSACTSGALLPSHVLLALGINDSLARSSIRFTFSENNTIEEIDFTVDCLKESISRLRAMCKQ